MSASESIATPVRPTSPSDARIVGVVAELRRQVERDREPRLPALEQVAVALVRLLGRREAGVLADRPRPAAIHVGIRAARVRELAGQLELARRVGGRVDGLHLDPGLRLALVGRRHARSMLAPCASWFSRSPFSSSPYPLPVGVEQARARTIPRSEASSSRARAGHRGLAHDLRRPRSGPRGAGRSNVHPYSRIAASSHGFGPQAPAGAPSRRSGSPTLRTHRSHPVAAETEYYKQIGPGDTPGPDRVAPHGRTTAGGSSSRRPGGSGSIAADGLGSSCRLGGRAVASRSSAWRCRTADYLAPCGGGLVFSAAAIASRPTRSGCSSHGRRSGGLVRSGTTRAGRSAPSPARPTAARSRCSHSARATTRTSSRPAGASGARRLTAGTRSSMRRRRATPMSRRNGRATAGRSSSSASATATVS